MIYNALKKKVYNIIREDDINNLIANIYDGIVIVSIIVSLVSLVVTTFEEFKQYLDFFNIVELVCVIIFIIDWILRFWTADLKVDKKSKYHPITSRLRYLISFSSIIDLLSIIPFLIPTSQIDGLSSIRLIKTLKFFRILRVAKFNRYTKSLTKINAVIKMKKDELFSSFFVILILIFSSSMVMYYVENEAQPEIFSNAFSGFWWAICTFTTVGYGDIYPITLIGKIVSIMITLLGVALVAIPTGIIVSGFQNIDNLIDKINDETNNELIIIKKLEMLESKLDSVLKDKDKN